MEEVIKAPKSTDKKAAAASVIVTKGPAAELLAALSSVTSVIERKHTLTILANVLIDKRGSELVFTGSDIEHQMRSSVDLGYGTNEVKTTVNARKLQDILKALPGEQVVTATLKDDKMVLTAGRSRFSVQTLPASDYPLAVEKPETQAEMELPQKVLLRLIEQVQYAMASNDIRFYLNSLLLETEGNTVRVVATDGHRLATSHATLDSDVSKASVLLPRKAVLELARLLKPEAPPVSITLKDNQAIFRFSGLEFITKLTEGKFPDYKRVLPANHETKVLFEREMLVHALQRARLMCSEKFQSVRLTFSPDKLELRSSNAQHEEAVEEIGIDYSGEPIEIGFNVNYLLEAVENMANDTVLMALKDASASVLLTDPAAPEFKGVCMPMRV